MAALVLTLLMACGGAPSATSPGPSVIPTGVPGATLSVGPVTTGLPGFEMPADMNSWLQASEEGERTRLRGQSGLAREIGPGWEAYSIGVDEATDAAAQAMAAEFSIDIPSARTHGLIASLVGPDRPAPARPASVAAGLAMMGAAAAAVQAISLGLSLEVSVNESTSTTRGDSVAEVTVHGTGSTSVSGSRVSADFQFDIVGRVSSITTGATVVTTGSAAVHIEIDGCPDANGASKGKVSLSSSESTATGVGWTRDVGGDFDLIVDDDANISRLNVDTYGDESVVPSEQPPGPNETEVRGHELGMRSHAEFPVGPGFSNFGFDESSLGLEITHEENAESVDLVPLFASALGAVVTATAVIGEAAEKFWRDGKCLELIVAPAGDDVDPSSETEVVVKVKHRFEGNELDKPVTATLSGVKSIEPAGQKVPAPATFTYTAGPKQGDKGDIEFESISNRGIAKKAITFTVKALGWVTTAASPLGEGTGVKCDGIGGVWTFHVLEHLGLFTITTDVAVTINAVTLAGTYTFHKLQVGGGTTTTADHAGAARIVLQEGGSVMMTLDANTITLVTTTQFGTGSATTPGSELIYPWTPATAEDCPTE